MCVVHETQLHISSLDLVMRQIMRKKIKKKNGLALTLIVFKDFCQPPLFHTATRLSYDSLNRIKNRISQLSAHFKMSVGGSGLVAYRLDKLLMFIHVFLCA